MATWRIQGCDFVYRLTPSDDEWKRIGAFVDAVREASCGFVKQIDVDFEGDRVLRKRHGADGIAEEWETLRRVYVTLILPFEVDPTKFGDALGAKVALILHEKEDPGGAEQWRKLIERAGFPADGKLIRKETT